MKIVLVQDVKSLGKKGEVVTVSDGYARNYLIPKGFGVEATSTVLNDIKNKEASKAHRIEVEREEAKKVASELEKVSVIIKVKSGGKDGGGKLYGAVTTKEISDLLKEQHGIEIDKRKIQLTDTIKQKGKYEVDVKLYAEITGKIRISVEEA